MASDAVQFRRDFWGKYAELFPDDGVPAGNSMAYRWIPVDSTELMLTLSVHNWGASIRLRERKNCTYPQPALLIQEYRNAFRHALDEAFDRQFPSGLGTEWGNPEAEYHAKREFDTAAPENWPDMAAWLHYMLHIYRKVIENALVRQG